MAITRIRYRFILFSRLMDRSYEADIPFAGDDPVLTETVRDSIETKISRFNLTEETIGEFKGLIDKYGIEDWAGKTPCPPVVCEDDNTHAASFLTLISDNGKSTDITFREVPEETGKEAAEAFRKLFFSCASNDKKLSEELVFPDLKQCREISEEHGPVTAVETGSFTSGMMMGSTEWYTQTIEKTAGKDGRVLVTVSRKRGNGPEVKDSKETDSDIFSRVQEISDKENLPGWHYAVIDPSIPVDTSMIPTDFTAKGWLSIYYDDSKITGCPRVKRTIGEKACKMGGKDVDRAITQMINDCVASSGAKVELPDVNPFTVPGMADPGTAQAPANSFMGMGMKQNNTPPNADGSWDCACGEKGLTGTFCPECGQKRP